MEIPVCHIPPPGRREMATRSIVFSIGIAGVLAMGPGLSAVRADSGEMHISGRTSQPVGHHRFCKKYPSECRQIIGRGPIFLSEDIWAKAQEINNEVNTEVRPLTDMEIWGVEERWSFPRSVGDCEDFVLEKRRRLMQAGISADNLLITVVRQMNGDGHAVLTLRTDHGDFILDNLEPRVLPWSKTDYRYLKRQSASHSGQWVSIDDSRNITVGSVR